MVVVVAAAIVAAAAAVAFGRAGRIGRRCPLTFTRDSNFASGRIAAATTATVATGTVFSATDTVGIGSIDRQWTTKTKSRQCRGIPWRREFQS